MGIVRHYGVAALLTALAANSYPAYPGPGGLAVAPPHAHPSPTARFHLTDERPGGVGPVEKGGEPAPSTPEQMPPMEKTPGVPKTPAQAHYEQRVGSELSDWEQRVSQFAQQADSQGSQRRGQADSLQRQLVTVKQQWESLHQANGTNWDTQKDQFEEALGRFQREWDHAQQK